MSMDAETMDALSVLFQTVTGTGEGEAGMTQPEEVAVIVPRVEATEAEGDAIQKRTVLLRLKISSFGTKVGVDPSKLPGTDEEKKAAAKSLGATKTILKSNRLDKITSLDGEFRRGIIAQALKVSFLKGGMYCIPASRAPKIEQEIEAYRTKRAAMVEDFIREEYTKIDGPDGSETCKAIAEARTRLEPLGLFNLADYPTRSRLRAGFTVETKFLQLEAPTVLKDVDAGLLARELEKEKAFWREAAYDVKAALRAQMKELLEHLVDRLTPEPDGKQKVFRNTLLDNMKEFFDSFGDKNIANDEELAKVVVKARSIVSGVTKLDEIRDNEVFRGVLAAEFTKLKASTDALVEEMPDRGIDLTA